MKIQSKTLASKKILVTAYDLEQSEHRGIAVYTKALIHCLRRAGAEVWLLTEFHEPLRPPGLRSLSNTNREIIRSARVLNSLAHGLDLYERPPNLIERKLALARQAKLWKKQLSIAYELLQRPRHYSQKNIYKFRIDQLFDSPYPRMERLSYFKDLKGIVCVPKLFFATQLAANLRKQKPVRLDLRDFDVLITSCPLNLTPEHIPTFVQTVHDLIPLEFVAHNEDPLMFSNRLQACLSARRLFVSQSTATKFDRHINKLQKQGDNESRQTVIVQPPSLRFPTWLTSDPENIIDMKPVSYLLHNDDSDISKIDDLPPMDKPIRITSKGPLDAPIRNTSKGPLDAPIRKRSQVLLPFRYFLFNSSVEARKNLLFLAQAYAESGLSRLGIQLCVTGKLKGDDYSKAVETIVQNESGILLTGYVDESTKLDLYLNALGLVSPSLVEGFGIPVLDGACLGMPTIASDCESHLEIQAIQDFKDSVITLDTLKSRNWSAAMQAIAGIHSDLWKNATKERKRRIGRYEKLRNHFYDQFQADLEEVLN